ncbi:MAG: DNA gyrase inhibitor YacG [Sphingosinicella sp.]|nr:DNA gyrase inhibitor YacG [Sphingosinicella sp.]
MSRRRNSCPLCAKPPSEAHKPFCGQGCRDRDLLKWLGEAYRVPGQPVDENAMGEEGHQGLDSEG